MEWKELEIDNLPPDILTGNYEFRHAGQKERNHGINALDALAFALKTRKDDTRFFGYEYRKPEPKAHTHEDIMTKWWKVDNYSWERVTMYFRNYGYKIGAEAKATEWFTGRESADIPPEAK